MTSIFIPKQRGRKKTAVRGFWKAQNKIYYDYLAIKEYNRELSYAEINSLRKQYDELAIFCKQDNTAYIVSETRVEKLNNKKVELLANSKNLRVEIQRFLNKFNGVTVYKTENGYVLESFYNREE